MRVFFLGNNRLACECLEWMVERDETIVGLAIHPSDRRAFGERLLSAASLPSDRIFDGSSLRDPAVLQSVRTLEADIAVSVLFGYILEESFIDSFPGGVINLHPSYLPYNRGSFPNVWSIVEETPAGVSLHYVDRGVDTGDVIERREVAVSPSDTGATLYRKLEEAAFALFREVWPKILGGDVVPVSQPEEGGSRHRKDDVERIDEIDLDRTYRARDLVNILRARTFPPHPGAYFVEDGRKVYMRLELMDERELEGEDDG